MMKRKLLAIVSPLLVLALVFSLVSVFLMPKAAAAAPAEVWVDENYCDGCPNDGHLWGYDAFDNIQDGIDAVASPGIVHVAAGHYWQHIDLKDGVQLLGAGAEVTTIDGGGAGSVVIATGVGPDTVLDGFTITNGYADGGGMRNTDSSPTVTNCRFSFNRGEFGGGMHNVGSSPTVANCIFDHNNAGAWGGGMYNTAGSSPTVTSCTFSGNSADDQGRGMFNYGSSPTVTNCILWDVGIGVEIYDATSTPSVTYCDVQGSYPGEGNIADDPMFVDPTGGVYRLEAGSPCIDVGNNTAVPGWLTTDFEGTPRILDGNGDGEAVVDMGAYEYFTWTCIFQDPARGTELRVSPDAKRFQFIAPGYDSGAVKAEHMMVCQVHRLQLILICHSDSEISLFAFAVGCENGFCIALARDMETGHTYFLFG